MALRFYIRQDGLFGVDSIFGLVGRFFIVTSGGSSVDGAILAILFAGIQQYTCRSTRIDVTIYSRWLRGKAAMTEPVHTNVTLCRDLMVYVWWP